MRNPYIVGTPVYREDFYGHQTLADDLLDERRQCIYLVGNRRINRRRRIVHRPGEGVGRRAAFAVIRRNNDGIRAGLGSVGRQRAGDDAGRRDAQGWGEPGVG